jgi:hypothetical protein
MELLTSRPLKVHITKRLTVWHFIEKIIPIREGETDQMEVNFNFVQGCVLKIVLISAAPKPMCSSHQGKDMRNNVAVLKVSSLLQFS